MVTSLKLADVVAMALGLPPETVVQHLRNLVKAELISFKGYGRGAAQMTPGDASRLLIAVAGADFVKDSLTTLRAFGQLLPIGYARREGPYITLEDHLAGLLATLASDAYAANDSEDRERIGHVGLSLMSVASVDPDRFPRIAISRSGRTGSGAISFATPTWQTPVISIAEYAMRMKGAGLIRERHVTREVMETIARSL